MKFEEFMMIFMLAAIIIWIPFMFTPRKFVEYMVRKGWAELENGEWKFKW